MGLKRWNGTSWVPTIYQPSLSASQILNDSTVTGGNVKAALESLASGSGGANIYIVDLQETEEDEELIIVGPTKAELKAAALANKQMLVRYRGIEYSEIQEIVDVYDQYGVCTNMAVVKDDSPEVPGAVFGYFWVFSEDKITVIRFESYDDTEEEWSLEDTIDLDDLESTDNKDSYSLTINSNHYPSSYVLNQMVPTSGTTGYFLQKGSNGVNTWAQVQSGTTWGSITGTLSSQTDLNNALNSKGTYTKPSDGIPLTDLTSAVQTSLSKADSAIQSHQDISGKENISNKVTSINSSSTDNQYPTAKCVYDIVGNIQSVLEAVL